MSTAGQNEKDYWASLHRRCINGYKKAREELVIKVMEVIYRDVYHIVKNQEITEEVIQEALKKIFINKLTSVKNPESLLSWCRSIARNLAYENKRTGKHHNKLLDLNKYECIPCNHTDPEKTLLEKERSELLKKAIKHLPSNLRTPLVLQVYEYRSVLEIAEILGKPVGTIKSLLNIARKKLKPYLLKYDIRGYYE